MISRVFEIFRNTTTQTPPPPKSEQPRSKRRCASEGYFWFFGKGFFLTPQLIPGPAGLRSLLELAYYHCLKQVTSFSSELNANSRGKTPVGIQGKPCYPAGH